VGLREILEDEAFKKRKNNLHIVLGKDVAGASWLYDLSRMPHLLVAGATNSGKSVCLNAIIISLLYQNNPDDLRFIMVDPNVNISNLDEDDIKKAIDSNKIRLNIPLLEEFKNSLLICDEIHNVPRSSSGMYTISTS